MKLRQFIEWKDSVKGPVPWRVDFNRYIDSGDIIAYKPFDANDTSIGVYAEITADGRLSLGLYTNAEYMNTTLGPSARFDEYCYEHDGSRDKAEELFTRVMHDENLTNIIKKTLHEKGYAEEYINFHERNDTECP